MALVASGTAREREAAGRSVRFLPRRLAALSAAVNVGGFVAIIRAAGGISDYRHAVGGELRHAILIKEGVRPTSGKRTPER